MLHHPHNKKFLLEFFTCISFTYRKSSSLYYPRTAQHYWKCYKNTLITCFSVLACSLLHSYILFYITTCSSFLLVSSVLRLTSYNASVWFWVYDSKPLAVFLTALKSIQSLVKGKYNHWCDSGNLILYSFMLSTSGKSYRRWEIIQTQM